MKTVYHEAMHPLGNLGLKISMAALESPPIPMHWHDAMEILFCLNGEVTIQIDHEAFLLSRNQLVVFDSKEMHSIQSASPLYMFLCIHVDKKQMALYCPDLELYHIQCQPLPLDHPKSTEYLTLCQLARDVVLVHPLKQAVKLRDPLLRLGQLRLLPGQLPPLFLGVLVHHQPDKSILVRLDIGYRGLQMGQHQGRQHLLPDIVDAPVGPVDIQHHRPVCLVGENIRVVPCVWRNTACSCSRRSRPARRTAPACPPWWGGACASAALAPAPRSHGL